MEGPKRANDPPRPAAASGAPSPASPTATGSVAPGNEFDFAIEEIAPTEQLKEGFTGQER